ncbi:hypothetical protein EMCRGX_G012231 [Ephydatia muelleri]
MASASTICFHYHGDTDPPPAPALLASCFLTPAESHTSNITSMTSQTGQRLLACLQTSWVPGFCWARVGVVVGVIASCLHLNTQLGGSEFIMVGDYITTSLADSYGFNGVTCWIREQDENCSSYRRTDIEIIEQYTLCFDAFDTVDPARAQLGDTGDLARAQLGDTGDPSRAQLGDTGDLARAQLGDTEDLARAQLGDTGDLARAQLGDTGDLARAQLGDTGDVARAQLALGDTGELARAQRYGGSCSVDGSSALF